MPIENSSTGSERWKGKTKKDGTPYNKPGPKPKDEGAHNKKREEIIKRETADGKKKHIGGGSKTEITVKTPGGIKPERRMDSSFEDVETGEITHHNVGRFNKRGDPIKRERDAESDVINHADEANRRIVVEEYIPDERN